MTWVTAAGRLGLSCRPPCGIARYGNGLIVLDNGNARVREVTS